MVKNLQKELKALWKPFLVVFLASFLIFNWNNISWIFNYRVVSRFFSNIFSAEVVTERKEIESEILTETGEEKNLEIPRIGITTPLIFVSEEKEVHSALDRGVVLFPGSVFPGENGQTVILGHSAPPGWPKIKYDWVFSRLNELNEGDEVFIYFNRQKYSYRVTGKFFLERGEEIPEKDLTNSKNVLILISCWPPGKDLRRIAVEAVLKR